MGKSKSPAEFSRKITQLATVTQRNQKEAVSQAAFTVKQIVLAEAAGKGVMPTSKIAGGKWGVRYDVRGFNNPSALVRVTGPFHLVDRPTKAHEIRPRGKGRRRSSGKKAVAFNGLVRASVQHPGTRGKGVWPASVQKARVAVPVVLSRHIVGGWRRALK